MKSIIEQKREIPVIMEVDVVVAGGGPAGVGAALAATRNGAKTLIVEQFGCLGGMSTSGLHTHMNQMNASWGTGKDENGKSELFKEQESLRDGGTGFILGGIPMEICEKSEKLNIGRLVRGVLDYEVEGMKRLLDEIILESGCSILFNTFVSDAIMEDGKVVGIIVENKTGRGAVLAKNIIDCTGDADVAARAGCEFDYGRECDGKVQPVTLMFRIGGCDTEKVKEYQREHGWRLKHVWAKAVKNGDMTPFNIHVCGFWYTCTRPDQIGVNFTNIPNINGTDVFDTTRAQIEGRRQAEITVNVMRKYIPGCENGYLIDTSSQLGVRETRRIKGEYTLSFEDVWNTRKFDDGIARGSFKIDIHTPGGAGQADGRHLPRGSYYDIPYGCIVPKSIDNILVAGRCISVSHEALGSTRVMFQCMALGQAAGTAAALCSHTGESPRKIDVTKLRKILTEQGAIL